jgi:oxaloacetate decarboxylase gamma subunit
MIREKTVFFNITIFSETAVASYVIDTRSNDDDYIRVRGGVMTIVEMLGQSGNLTLLGMGTVFGFLVILVIVISQMGKLLNARDSDGNTSPVPAGLSAKETPGTKAGITSVPADTADNARVTAAVSAAITEYRKS